eukprot:15010080-Alexandrium_andersonii.AAC.1
MASRLGGRATPNSRAMSARNCSMVAGVRRRGSRPTSPGCCPTNIAQRRAVPPPQRCKAVTASTRTP